MNNFKNVDDYIKSAPPEIMSKLQSIRTTIKSIAPECEEKISYGMPYYGFKGRLAYFAYFKSHISFFAMNGVLEDFRKEVVKYKTGKATLRFNLEEPLPLRLIEKLLKATLKKNKSKI